MRVEPHHSVGELRALIRTEPNARVVRRLQAVLAAAEGETADGAATRCQLSSRAVGGWVRRYNAAGVAGLTDKAGRGRKKPLTAEQEATFRARIRAGAPTADGVCTLRGEDVRAILKAEFGIVRSLQTTYNLLHAMGFSVLRPRPQHPKADVGKQAAFKKNSRTRSRKSSSPTRAAPSRSGSRTKPASGKKAR